jgi:hypothetical protein
MDVDLTFTLRAILTGILLGAGSITLMSAYWSHKDQHFVDVCGALIAAGTCFTLLDALVIFS